MPCLAIDGDTVVCQGVHTRLVGFNTPEIHSPACGAEKAVAYLAKLRTQKLLDGGAFVIRVTCYGDRPFDKYGRQCGLLMTPEGADAADILIAEGLAEPYWPRTPTLKRGNWCRHLWR